MTHRRTIEENLEAMVSIIEETLTDGSKAYNVTLNEMDCEFQCIDRDHAVELFNSITKCY